MNLAAAGREYINWPYTSDSEITSADVWLNNAWWPATITSSDVTLLIAGPRAASNPGGTVVLPMGTHAVQVRFNDTPELVVRDAGTIVVY